MKKILVKASKTFIQAAVAYICGLNLTGMDFTNKNILAGFIISTIAAGLAALMNVDWESAEKTEDEKVGELYGTND